jgi:hypothetical protein
MTVSLHKGSLPRRSRLRGSGDLEKDKTRVSLPARWYTGTCPPCDEHKGMPAEGNAGTPVCERQFGIASHARSPGGSNLGRRKRATVARFSGMGTTVAACSI